MSRTLTASTFALAVGLLVVGISLTAQSAPANQTNVTAVEVISDAHNCTTLAMLAADPTSGRVATMARASCR